MNQVETKPTRAPLRPMEVEAGHQAARFRFVVPAGFRPLAGVTLPTDPQEIIEFSDQRPAGVGIFEDGAPALNSIVVFSDPEGLGVDASALNEPKLVDLSNQYVLLMREQFPSASDATVETVGDHQALRIELPRVEMPNRPIRSGRHYLLFSGKATASVDCLWTPDQATRLDAACHDVAADLTRVQ